MLRECGTVSVERMTEEKQPSEKMLSVMRECLNKKTLELFLKDVT